MDRLEGRVTLTLQAPPDAAATFVVIDVLDAFQQLTLSAYGGLPAVETRDLVMGNDPLSPGQTLEENSDQNDTLIIAIGPVKLRDVWNLKDESEWQPSKPVLIQLPPGGAQWTKPGMHEFKNIANTSARFVTVEW